MLSVPQSFRLPRPNVELTEVHSVAGLEAIRGEWLELWRVSGTPPFQSPMWLIPWARRFTGENLRAVIVRESGTRLAGVALFYLWADPKDGPRRLLLAGNGISDHLDICVAPGAAAAVLSEISGWLESSAEWDVCEWNQLEPQAAVRLLGCGSCRIEERAGDPSPALDLRGKTTNAFAPKRQLEKLQYYRRRLSKIGEFSVRRAELAEVCSWMDKLFELHAARWKKRGEAGMLGEPDIQQFHREAAVELCAAGALRLYRLEFNGGTMGILYAFANSTRTCFYLSGFDPDFERFSPGTVLVGHAIEQALAEEHLSFDFLRGQEPYKYSWGAEDCPAVRRFLLR